MNQSKIELNEALRHLKIADHMIYVTYPVIKEKKFLIKIFKEINLSVRRILNALVLTNSNNNNIEKLLENLEFNKENIKIIKEILELGEYYKQKSVMEFVKKEKIVLLSKDLDTQVLDLEKIKNFMIITKEMFLKANRFLNKS